MDNSEEGISSTLKTMLCQEEVYSCRDYILQDNSHDARWLLCRMAIVSSDDLDMNRVFRSTMVKWGYQVTDFAKFRRETVEYALSYFDRFLQTPAATEALQNRLTFQCAFITCLYLAVKLHEPTTMSPSFFSILSKGQYDMKQIEKMELKILSALQWRMNPPTALGFVRHLVALHPLNKHIQPAVRDTIYDLAKVQVELQLDDYRFVSVKKSIIAVSAILNAMESLQIDPNFGIAQFATLAGLKSLEEVTQVRAALYQVVAKLPHLAGSFSACSKLGTTVPRRAVVTPPPCQQSPRSVYTNYHALSTATTNNSHQTMRNNNFMTLLNMQ